MPIAFAELDGQERRGGNVEIERAPAPRNSGIGQQLFEQRARFHAADSGRHIAMQPLDERAAECAFGFRGQSHGRNVYRARYAIHYLGGKRRPKNRNAGQRPAFR
jgi:hypothetical protein